VGGQTDAEEGLIIIGKLFRDVNVTPGEVKYLGDLPLVTHKDAEL
jgi:hypothetical protein